MTVFVDTSAIFAILAASDEHHKAASVWLADVGLSRREQLITHNYVVLESAALIHRRLGTGATRALFHDLLPVIPSVFVDEPLHRAGVGAFLAFAPRGISLVDSVSFEFMRNAGIGQAFAFDPDFRVQGFQTVP